MGLGCAPIAPRALRTSRHNTEDLTRDAASNCLPSMGEEFEWLAMIHSSRGTKVQIKRWHYYPIVRTPYRVAYSKLFFHCLSLVFIQIHGKEVSFVFRNASLYWLWEHCWERSWGPSHMQRYGRNLQDCRAQLFHLCPILFLTLTLILLPIFLNLILLVICILPFLIN